MNREKLDEKDKELLIMLANHPDWTYEKIAEKMGMTSRSVGYRIERLRELKILQKANLIYYDRLGDLIYSVVLKFDTGLSPQDQEKVLRELKSHPATIQVFTAIGAFSAILLFHAETPREAERLIRELVIGNKCFSGYEISQITEIYSIYRHYY
ncbi:MAG: winged helix-turn-helix transcriptional regulator [Methanomassiliicoccales archaeon]|jgi:DNA-binding Lrp family transcriptional regulator|nr:winged helix-turn-helix transcriptional regulator [Methanomassiliicoccales archaeon]